MPSTMRPTRAARRTIAFAAAAIVVASCGAGGDGGAATVPVDDAERSSELADVLRAHGLESASSAVDALGLDSLSDAAEYTFFVPSDEAFQSLGADEIAELFDDSDRLGDVLRDHVVTGRIPFGELAGVGELTTADGLVLTFDGASDPPTVGGVRIVEVDIEVGTSGVVHVIDRLVVP